MKKLLLLIAAVASFASCVQNIEGVDTSLGYTTITVGMPESRTSLGAKDENGIYAIYWSEGDKIVANGAASSRMDIGDNKKSATFHFEGSLLVPPYHLTYPYTANSACADGKPTVVFAANQEYVEGSFGVGYAPMCGYIESGEASMQHLAGVLQFTVKGTNKLSKIEIIAEEGKALAGEFDVDCESGTLTAINGEVSNKITYTVNQTLTEDGTAFHITVPKGIEGVCKVVLTDSAGQKMNLKWTASNVSAGVVREFTPFAFKGGASFELQEMTSITDEMEVEERTDPTSGVWGYIKYDDGTPAVGVSVSDGFSVVTTDALGLYHFADGVDDRTYYIYYSIPATAKVVVNDDGYHTFFKKYSSGIARYDFTLERIEKESAFSLFAIADTHGARAEYVDRIEAECLGGVKIEKQNRGTTPCYAVILGDIVCCAAKEVDTSEDNQQQKSYYMPLMREMFAPKNTGGVPTFYVMGNHDHEKAHFDTAKETYSSDLESFNFYAQRAFEEMFAPADYSFNRGDVHIVCMRNSQWEEYCLINNTSNGNYNYGDFTDEQVEWLRQDLVNVPKSNKIILCVHIPMRLNHTRTNVQKVAAMLKEYNEPQILSGHTHINFDLKVDSKKFTNNLGVSEKTVSGNWGTGAAATKLGFTGKLTADGVPFGFDVYDVSGARFTDHYYVDCTSQKSYRTDTDYVMRVHLSKDIYGGDCNGDGKVNKTQYFMFPNYVKEGYYDTYIHVHLLSGNPDTWTVELYVDDGFVKELTYAPNKITGAWTKQQDDNGEFVKDDNDNYVYVWSGNGSGTYDDPWWPKVTGNSQDWWYIAYRINEGSSTYLTTSCYRMWYGFIPQANLADVKAGNFYIKATHTEFGKTRIYTTNKIFGQNDYNGYVNYKPKNE